MQLWNLYRLRRANRSKEVLLGLLYCLVIISVLGAVLNPGFELRHAVYLFCFILMLLGSIQSNFWGIVTSILLCLLSLAAVIGTIQNLSPVFSVPQTLTIIIFSSLYYFLSLHIMYNLFLAKRERRILQFYTPLRLLYALRRKSGNSYRHTLLAILLEATSALLRSLSNYLCLVLLGISVYLSMAMVHLLLAGEGLVSFFNTVLQSFALNINSFNSLLSLAILFFGPLVLARLAVLAKKRGRNYRRQAFEQLVQVDSRPPVLFLRSFRDDQVTLPKTPLLRRLWAAVPEPQRLDHKLIEEFSYYGPVVALGKPGEEALPYGAARLYVAHADWQEKVLEIAREARAIVVVADRNESRVATDGLDWEIEQLLQPALVEKALFLMSHQQQPIDLRYHHQFAALLQPFRKRRRVLAVFNRQGQWHLLHTIKAGMDDYLVSCQVFFEQLPPPVRRSPKPQEQVPSNTT